MTLSRFVRAGCGALVLAGCFNPDSGSDDTGLGTDDTSGTMVTAMIELARGLGIKVVAEQVETQDAFDRVKAMRVDFVQGYIVGRPQPLPIGGAG